MLLYFPIIISLDKSLLSYYFSISTKSDIVRGLGKYRTTMKAINYSGNLESLFHTYFKKIYKISYRPITLTRASFSWPAALYRHSITAKAIYFLEYNLFLLHTTFTRYSFSVRIVCVCVFICFFPLIQ